MEKDIVKSVAPEKKKMGHNELYILLAILAILLIGVSAFLMYIWTNNDISLDSSDNDSEVTSTESETVQSDNVVDDDGWINFSGDYLTAEIPSDWNIIELTPEINNEYTKHYIEDNYDGFYGFVIEDENGNKLGSLEPAFATGGSICSCTKYNEFEDDIANGYEDFVSEQLDLCSVFALESGYINTADLVEIYAYDSEIEFLSNYKVRRVEGEYYIDSELNDEYFTVDCYKHLSKFITVGDSWTVTGGGMPWGSEYQFLMATDYHTDEGTLESVDRVIESIDYAN